MRTYRTLTIALGAVLSLSAQAPPDFTPPTPLFAAVLSNNTPQVKKLLVEGANPNEKQFLGFAPILSDRLSEPGRIPRHGREGRRYPGQRFYRLDDADVGRFQ
jgi:hypothetical protein